MFCRVRVTVCGCPGVDGEALGVSGGVACPLFSSPCVVCTRGKEHACFPASVLSKLTPLDEDYENIPLDWQPCVSYENITSLV